MKIKSLILASGLAALIAGCGTEGKKPKGTSGGTSSDVTTCYGATAEIDSSGLVRAWQEEGSYGANHVYVYELADTCSNAENCFKDGSAVKDYIIENELLPKSSPVWEANRNPIGDGNDPRKFTEEDPLVIGYLPFIPKSMWGWSNDNVKYDWSCADSQCTDKDGAYYNINHACEKYNGGLENCVGKNQLDKMFTQYTLRSGKRYLLRFLFGSSINGTNWIEFCNQTAFEYKK